MVRPTRHVGAGLRGLLGPTAHGFLGRRHPGPHISHMVGWGWSLKYRDSQIFVRGAWHVPSYLGVWSLGLFSPTFFSTSSKKKGSPVLPCPIINAQNRNEARIPVFTRQGRPTEIVSLYVHFLFVFTEDRAQWPPVVRNMSQRCFQLSSSKEYVTEMFSTFERQIFRSSVVHISWGKADFYENRNWWNPLIWSEFQKKKKICDKSVSGEDSTWGLMRVKPNNIPLRYPGRWLKYN